MSTIIIMFLERFWDCKYHEHLRSLLNVLVKFTAFLVGMNRWLHLLFSQDTQYFCNEDIFVRTLQNGLPKPGLHFLP